MWVGKRGFPTPGSQRAVDGWGGGGGGELGCFNVYAGKRGEGHRCTTLHLLL